MNHHKLKELIDQLIILGEERDELDFWHKLYPTLEIQEQEALVKNLQKELEQLQKIEEKIRASKTSH